MTIQNLSEQFESHHAQVVKQAESIEQLQAQLDRVETKVNRPSAAWTGVDNSEEQSKRNAFTKFIRYGREALVPEEIKAMVLSDDTQGGFLAPEEFVAELIKNIVRFSPVRAVARVGQTANGWVKIPKRTGTLTASWVGETEERSATQPSYGQLTIPVDEAGCYLDMSNTTIEDSAIDLAAELAMDFAEEFGRLEGAAFVNGTGVKQPFGFMQDPDIAYVPSGASAAIKADALIDALYALAPFYRGNSTWMLNGTTLATVRKLKDSNGQYLWQPGIAAGQPETILGRPVIEAVDMPDIASGTFPIAVGDFQQGYRIYDRLNLAILRDPFSIATSGQIRVHARRRVGGGVAKAEALRKIKIATS